jgi:hypothetical protein
MIGDQKKREPAIHGGCSHSSANNALTVAQVPFVFLKALDRFILATLNVFLDTFRYQVHCPAITMILKHKCLRADATRRHWVSHNSEYNFGSNVVDKL